MNKMIGPKCSSDVQIDKDISQLQSLSTISVAYPPYNSHLNWIIDPAPPPSRDHGDLTSPAPSRDHGIPPSGKENTPPQSTPLKLPEKIRPRRRKEKQPGSTANHNSPSWKAGRETQCEPASNHNSPSREAGRETQPGSTTNHNSPPREAGSQPGISRSTGSAMHTPVDLAGLNKRPDSEWSGSNQRPEF